MTQAELPAEAPHVQAGEQEGTGMTTVGKGSAPRSLPCLLPEVRQGGACRAWWAWCDSWAWCVVFVFFSVCLGQVLVLGTRCIL